MEDAAVRVSKSFLKNFEEFDSYVHKPKIVSFYRR